MPTTLRTLALAWRKAKEPLIKRSSLYAYQINIKNYLLPRWGKATAIAEAEVQQFILEAAEGGLAKNTIRNIVATLKAILKYGARNGLCAPPEWELHYPRWLDTPRIQTLSLSQHRALLHYLVSTPSPHNIGLLLALCTGMRIGEVCALQWQDVDLHERILRVHQTYGYIYNCDTGCVEKQLSTPKTQHANREIPISRELYHALSQLRSTHPTDFVVGHSSAPTSPQTYRLLFKQVLQRLAIPHISFHALRHTFATRCIESQCDYKTVSALLGHSTVNTTLNLYVHPDRGQKQRAIARMSAFVNPKEKERGL